MLCPRSTVLTLTLTLALGACTAAPRAALAPLETLRPVEAELVVRPTERGLERPRWDPWTEEQIASSPGRVSIRVRFAELDAEAARELLGDQSATLVSLIVSREESERLFENRADPRPEREYFNDSSLVLHEEQRGYVSVTDQRAYVSGFAIRSNGNVAAADPRVEVVSEGVQLMVVGSADRSDGRVTLELGLEECSFDREFTQRDFAVAGGRVTTQEPRGLSRSLATRVTLARDEALILGGTTLVGHTPGRALFALVEAEAAVD
ncbi:MAG TPA: hypothetical protein VMT18_08490 [Planctomycetota bacterium]|nr:hypothetical protein [Planctomycetota bacterium]